MIFVSNQEKPVKIGAAKMVIVLAESVIAILDSRERIVQQHYVVALHTMTPPRTPALQPAPPAHTRIYTLGPV
jgi:hypothetical protein